MNSYIILREISKGEFQTVIRFFVEVCRNIFASINQLHVILWSYADFYTSVYYTYIEKNVIQDITFTGYYIYWG